MQQGKPGPETEARIMSPAMIAALVQPYKRMLDVALAQAADASTEVVRLAEANAALQARVAELEAAGPRDV